MIEYGCPICGKKLFEAEAPVLVKVYAKCRHHDVVEAVPRGWQVTYRCSKCGRTQHCERPPQGKVPYCVVCGRQTLTIVAQHGERTTSRHETVQAVHSQAE